MAEDGHDMMTFKMAEEPTAPQQPLHDDHQVRQASTTSNPPPAQQPAAATTSSPPPEEAATSRENTGAAAISREQSGRTDTNASTKTNTPPPQRRKTPFPVRLITYYGRQCYIILQEENGPCPLIALCNILSLRGRMDLGRVVKGGASQFPIIPRDDLANALATLIMERLESGVGASTGDSATRRYTFTDALDNLPKFVEGMDLNVRFFKVDDFEASSEVAVLDAAGVELVHGWIVDPEMKELIEELKPNHGYNAMVEKAMNDQAPRFKEWLNQTATQLTFAGLFELQSNLKEGDLKMLFRNNHYSVITKKNNTLWTLISDAGMSRSTAIWESMVDVEGLATEVVDAHFGERPARVSPPPPAGHRGVGGGAAGIQQGRIVRQDDFYSPSQHPQNNHRSSSGGASHHGGSGAAHQHHHQQGGRGQQEPKRRKTKASNDDCCTLM